MNLKELMAKLNAISESWDETKKRFGFEGDLEIKISAINGIIKNPDKRD